MPAKKGGFGQIFNVQALATAGKQVILAIMRHDNPMTSTRCTRCWAVPAPSWTPPRSLTRSARRFSTRVRQGRQFHPDTGGS